MLALEEALSRILASIPSQPTERVALTEACGRIISEKILAPIDLPPFDNSAMDGYAVRAEDVARAKAESPVRLQVIGKIGAGEVFAHELKPGTCVRLFTGAPLPPRADAVVMQEDTRVEQREPNAILVLDAPKPWENVRLRGEDVKRTAPIVDAGELLTIGKINLLAATGCAEVSVGRQPLVALLSTGSELKESGQPLAPGQIYESNRIGLAELTHRAGGVAKIFPLVEDTLQQTQVALTESFEQCDFVVTSGGVSVGEMDYLKQAFENIGGKLQFWKVAIKPGRPFVFGRLREKYLFGLPGNPISALVTFLLLVRPALLRWQGARETRLPSHPAVLAEPLSNPGERRHFMRVIVEANGQVHSAGLQASHALSSMAAANGLIDVPPNTTLQKASIIQVFRWE